MNAYLHSYLKALPSSDQAKFSFANAIWFKDQADFVVEKDFLQANVNYFDAAIRKAAFDDSTVQEINQWVDQHTDHMIPKLLDQLSPDARMLLVNALVFDGKWQSPFKNSNIQEGPFANLQGGQDTASFMSDMEYVYYEDDEVIGFAKDYMGESYRFVALLPKEADEFESYVQGLSGEKLSRLLENEQEAFVSIKLPKFSFDYEISLTDTLMALGMQDAFDDKKADFSGISRETPLFISDVLHKTHIDLDSEGTRAAAVTAVSYETTSALYFSEYKEVYLDRPFVYMILDKNDVPVFIGVATDLKAN